MKLKNVNQQVAQIDDFDGSIKNNRATPVDGEMGKQDVKILQAIYTSMHTSNRIAVK